MSKHSLLVGCLFLLLIGIVGCKTKVENVQKKQVNQPVKNPFYPSYPKPHKKWVDEKLDSIRLFYQTVIAPAGDMFSGQFLVAKNGHVLFSRYNGFADKKKNSQMTHSTPIHVASIS